MLLDMNLCMNIFMCSFVFMHACMFICMLAHPMKRKMIDLQCTATCCNTLQRAATQCHNPDGADND